MTRRRRTLWGECRSENRRGVKGERDGERDRERKRERGRARRDNERAR